MTSTRRSALKSSPVLDWLLEKADPGVRYFTLRDLLGAPADDPDLLAARRDLARRELAAARELVQRLRALASDARRREASGSRSRSSRDSRWSTPRPRSAGRTACGAWGSS